MEKSPLAGMMTSRRASIELILSRIVVRRRNRRSACGESSSPSTAGAGTNAGQIIEAQELCQDEGVDLVGPDVGLGDRLRFCPGPETTFSATRGLISLTIAEPATGDLTAR